MGLLQLMAATAADTELADSSQIAEHVTPAVEPPTVLLTVVRLTQQHLAVSGGKDQTLRVWDLEEGTCAHVLRGSGGSITGLEVDWETRRALSGSMDHVVRLWDLRGGRCLHAMPGHANIIRGVLVDWPASVALTYCQAGLLILWDLRLGTARHLVHAHAGPICDAEVDWETMRVLSLGEDYCLRLWDLDKGVQIFSLHKTGIEDLEECVEVGLAIWWENNIALCCWNHTIHVLDLTLGTLKLVLQGHTLEVKGISPDWAGSQCLSWGEDGQLRLWSLLTGDCVRTLSRHGPAICGVHALWGDRPRALSYGSEHNLRLWDLSNECTPAVTCVGHTDVVGGVDVSWENMKALSWSDDHTLRLWDLVDGCCLRNLVGHVGPVWSAHVDWHTNRALSYSFSHGVVLLWDLGAGGPAKEFVIGCHGDFWNGGVEVDWARDRAIAWSLGDAKLWVLRLAMDPKLAVRELVGHDDQVSCVSFETSD